MAVDDGSYAGMRKTITEGVSQRNNIAAHAADGGAALTPDRYRRSQHVWGLSLARANSISRLILSTHIKSALCGRL